MTDYCALGNSLIKEYPQLHGWRCKINNERESWGVCNYSRKTIYLSKFLIDLGTHAEIVQTIYHELAHALTEKYTSHGPEWLAQARELGYTGNATADRALPVKHKYIGHCANGHRFGMHRMRAESHSCSICEDAGLPLDDVEITWYDRRNSGDVQKFISIYGGFEFEEFESDFNKPLTPVGV